MFAKLLSRFACLQAVLGTLAVLSSPCLLTNVFAEEYPHQVVDTIEVPRDRLLAIEQELAFLRARDSQQQMQQNTPQDSFIEGDIALVSNNQFTCGQSTSCGCLDLPSEGFACDCCHCQCYPCLCPLPEAPCIECPHVSTLSPYFNVSVFGALKLDMLFGGARAVSPGTPFFLAPGVSPGFEDNYVSLHARQSTLGAAFTGPQFGGFQSGGTIIAMFFNDNVVADQYGLLPLQAFGELRNQDWRFAAGLQFDVFSPGVPTVLPFSALAGSGNAGNSFRGQLRVERFLYPSEEKQWTLQFALSEPVVSTIDSKFRLLEDNGWPNVEGRIALGLGAVQGQGAAAKRPFEVGVSGIVGQLRSTEPAVRQIVANVWGVAVDYRWKVNDFWGFQGEMYTGQGLGTYNGGILQNLNATTLQSIRTSGGFGEVYCYWTPCLHSHFGYGVDNPLDRDLDPAISAAGRTRNSTVFANAIWDVNATFRIGCELTWRETSYISLSDNEGLGFQTQFQWAF